MLKRVNGIYTEYEDSAILIYKGIPFTGVKYFTYPNGQIQKERSYYEGRETGFDRSWYPNGVLKHEIPKISSSSIIETWKEWYSNKQLKTEGFKEHGVTIKSKTCNEDGELIEEWEFPQNESEPIYQYLQMLRKDFSEHPPDFLEFEKKIEEYLAKYPSDNVYYEKDFVEQ
ncbi:MAG TPA: hypothetical protein V6D15_16250 [Oculatellaceae cyanobacterium]|jgi:antitoxin component YwqK of YwqJK toxin-antitoxin module